VVLSGAGVSAESGLQTFRGAGAAFEIVAKPATVGVPEVVASLLEAARA
jgi:NAD-dependent SIR2 family protein deacetylase